MEQSSDFRHEDTPIVRHSLELKVAAVVGLAAAVATVIRAGNKVQKLWHEAKEAQPIIPDRNIKLIQRPNPIAPRQPYPGQSLTAPNLKTAADDIAV